MSEQNIYQVFFSEPGFELTTFGFDRTSTNALDHWAVTKEINFILNIISTCLIHPTNQRDPQILITNCKLYIFKEKTLLHDTINFYLLIKNLQ